MRTPLKPLAGLRFSIKDNFKLSGIMATQSNRAWCELYNGQPENETAAYVKTLVDLGAVFVGTTRMCSFASGEEATDQWIDFHAPFNPRGDGYQTPSGSSTGAGTSLATYDWLDYSIGTDSRFYFSLFSNRQLTNLKLLEVFDGLRRGADFSVSGRRGKKKQWMVCMQLAGMSHLP